MGVVKYSMRSVCRTVFALSLALVLELEVVTVVLVGVFPGMLSL